METHGREGVMTLYRGVVEAFPDCQWTVENARNVTVERVGKDGSRDIRRAVAGFYRHQGSVLYAVSITRMQCCNKCVVHSVATMVTPVFEERLEKKLLPIGVKVDQELLRQRPIVQSVETNGIYIFFLSDTNRVNNGHRNNNEIETFYMVRHTVAKKVYIPGVNADF
jgi:hypothetical protein